MGGILRAGVSSIEVRLRLGAAMMGYVARTGTAGLEPSAVLA